MDRLMKLWKFVTMKFDLGIVSCSVSGSIFLEIYHQVRTTYEIPVELAVFILPMLIYLCKKIFSCISAKSKTATDQEKSRHTSKKSVVVYLTTDTPQRGELFTTREIRKITPQGSVEQTTTFLLRASDDVLKETTRNFSRRHLWNVVNDEEQIGFHENDDSVDLTKETIVPN